MSHKIAIVGATGAVGQEVIRLIDKLKVPYESLHLMASAKSAGTVWKIHGKECEIKELAGDAFEGIDYAIFCTSSDISKKYIPAALASGTTIIDNSSAFRLDPEVPLVIPEINGHLLKTEPKLIANPNCTTTIALMGLYPLHKLFKIKRFWASSYQAVSGSGKQGMHELIEQTMGWANRTTVEPKCYDYPIAFNVIPQIGDIDRTGYSEEELKMTNESRKILEVSELRTSVTCVRVPTWRAHGVAINAEFEKSMDLNDAIGALRAAEGLTYFENALPCAVEFSEKIECGIGRVRLDSALDNGLSFWVVGDQLWKGAALNSLQILERLMNSEVEAVY